MRPIFTAFLAVGISLAAAGNLASAPLGGVAVIEAANGLSPLTTVAPKKGNTVVTTKVVRNVTPTNVTTPKKPKQPRCSEWQQSGRKTTYNCKQDPTMAQELADQARIKAQQKPKPINQTCRMVRGQLVCS